MKVIKRDGRIVDFDKYKIILAIEKANNTVIKKEQAKKKEIDTIIDYIESLDKKRILVEDVQDIIEMKLMEMKHYELAKKYIVYRYNRALVRRQNTTDETILGLIRKNDPDYLEEKTSSTTIVASTQRNIIALEVSKDLTKRLLLPQKINKAHDEGKIYFHDREYFLQPIFGSCLINLKDMLENGTIVNEKRIEPPKSFQTACNIMTQIITIVASSQYGEQSLELKHLGKYLRISKHRLEKEMKDKYQETISEKDITSIIEDRLKKELSSGVQTIQYQLNTLLSITGKSPEITLFMHLDKDDPYIEENAMIFEELLNQRYEGMKNEEHQLVAPTFPKLLYVLDENNILKGGTYDYITKLALKCARERHAPDFISAKKLKEIYHNEVHSPIGTDIFPKNYKENDQYKWEGRFHQGRVTINLPQIALSTTDEDSFFSLLKERLELCYEALMCRHYALLSITSDISPIHYQHGAVARFSKGKKIEPLLKSGNSFLSLGYIGLDCTIEYLLKQNITTKDGKELSIKIINYLKKTTDKWEKQTNIGFQLYQTTSPIVASYLKEIDDYNFKPESTTNDYSPPLLITESQDDKLKLIQDMVKIAPSGIKTLFTINSFCQNEEEIIPFLYENILYSMVE